MVCLPLLHQLHTGGHTGAFRARSPLSLLQLQTYSFLLLSSLPAALTSLLSEPRDSVPLLRSPRRSLGLMGQVRTELADTGVLRRCQRQRDVVYGVGAGSSGPGSLGTSLWVPYSFPSQPCCWGRRPARSLGALGPESTRGQRRAVPPLLCSVLGRRLWLFDDF